MIKKVRVNELRVGIYVHDYDCAGNNTGALFIDPGPIRRESAIKILKTWGFKEVFIDTSRGLDVDQNESASRSQSLTKPAGMGRDRPRVRPEVPLAVEKKTAAHLSRDAMLAVRDAYNDVLRGQVPEAGHFYALAERMYDSIRRNSDALTLLSRIREKDSYTLYHSINVCSYVLALCRYYGMNESLSLDMAVGALFHDIGKARIPQEILGKAGRLTPEESAVMKKHAEYSGRLLRKIPGLPAECIDIAIHHHERYDGAGYPEGLAREQISFGAQMISICDVFDALVSERCYKPAMETVKGLRIIYESSNTHFDRSLVFDFIRCIGMYPVGTCVTLADGRSGVVVGSTEDVKRPVVQVLYDECRRKRLEQPETVDLSKTGGTVACYSNTGKFGFSHEKLLLNRLFSA